jgi:hypothetical protein
MTSDDARRTQRPRHRALLIFGISVLALWFPISFGGLVNYCESTSPIVTLLVARDDVALAVLLHWACRVSPQSFSVIPSGIAPV